MGSERLLKSRTQSSEPPELLPLLDEERLTGTSTGVHIVGLLWRQRPFLFRLLWRGLLVCTLVAFLIPNRYESTTRIMPPDNQNPGMSMLLSVIGGATGTTSSSAGLGGAVGSALGMKGTSDLFVGVLESDRVLQRIVDRFDLRKVYGERYNVLARKKLKKRTTTDQDRKSGIISLTVEDRDPKRAAAMAHAYVDELNNAIAEVSTSSARRERIFLEDRLKAVKQELDESAVAFSQFASKNTAIDIPQQGKAMMEAAARLQGELIAAQSEQKSLEAIYTANNVRVRAVQARINELQSELQKLGSAGTDGQPQSSLYPSIRQLPILGVTYANLYRQTKIEETVYEFLTKEYEIAKVQEAKEIPTARVLDEALVPERKAFPPRLLLVIVGTLLTVVLGGVWLVARNHWHAVPEETPWKMLAGEIAESARPVPDSRLERVFRKVKKLLGRQRRTSELEHPEPFMDRDNNGNGLNQ